MCHTVSTQPVGRFSIKGRHFEIQNAVIGMDVYHCVRSVSCDWKLIAEDTLTEDDNYGTLQAVRMTFLTPGGLEVEWTGGLYRDEDVFSCRMRVTNVSQADVLLRALVPICARGTEGGCLKIGDASPGNSIVLDNGKWMADCHTLHSRLDPRKIIENYHVSAIMDQTTRKGVVLGMGERTNTFTVIEESLNRTGFDISLLGLLDTDLNNRPLRIRPGSSFEMNRVVLVAQEDIFRGFEMYGDYLARFVQINPEKIRHAAGLFSVYGQEKADTDQWERIALTDQRIAEFMDVLDRYCKPYGIEYIKTQFGGASSGPSFPNGLNIYRRKDWTDQPVYPLPEKDRTLAGMIETDGFTPDTCDIHTYHPQGIGAMCYAVHQRGYKNALVCRPYLNVRAGSPERERLCADIFKMAVEQWGYDYLMMDFIDADFENELDDTITIAQSITVRMQTIREAVGDDVYIEVCMAMPGCILGIADSYRPTMDYRGGTEEELVGWLSSMYFLHNKVFSLDSEFFDPDITPFVWGIHHEAYNRIRYFGSLDRIRSWATWCGITGYNIFTGGVIDDVSPERWNIFTRMLPVYGHTSAMPLDIAESQHPSQWKLDGKNAAGEYAVISLFNWDSLQQKAQTVCYTRLGLNPDKRYIALSFWEEKAYELYDGITFNLPPSSCVNLFVHELGDQPVYLGANRHVTDAFGLFKFSYDSQTGTIAGESEAPENTAVTHYIYMPSNQGLVTHTGCSFDISQPGVIRITAQIGKTGKQCWDLTLDRHKKTI